MSNEYLFISIFQSSPFSFLQKQTEKPQRSPIVSQAPQVYRGDIEDDEMNQVVTSNAVDYNTNDSKYLYDDFTENDYIATGDIISKQTNNAVEYSTNDNKYM